MDCDDGSREPMDWFTDVLCTLGYMQAWDAMGQVHVAVLVAGSLVVRLESCVGLRNGAALARLSRPWWMCWSNAQRHCILREFGLPGLYPSLGNSDPDASDDDVDAFGGGDLQDLLRFAGGQRGG